MYVRNLPSIRLCVRLRGSKEWRGCCPSSGPVTTVAIPEICPRSLMLLAAIMKRLESPGISVLRSVNTSSCEMKPWDQPVELKVLPTTWPRLLMPVAKAAESPGRIGMVVTLRRSAK